MTRRYAMTGQVWAFLPIALLLCLLGAAGWHLVDARKTDLFVGRPRPVPQLRLPTLSGGEMIFPGPADQAPLLVNFWASWCAPCAVEHPILMRLASNGVRIEGIAYKDRPDDAARLLSRRGNPYAQIGLDQEGDAGLSFGITGVPETFLIDASGQIAYVHRGPLDAEAVRMLGRLLESGGR